MTERLRAIWPLLKARITSTAGGEIKIAIGGSTTITVTLPVDHPYDIKEGDQLTIYTEVLFKEHGNA
jgi:hypothetical protein